MCKVECEWSPTQIANFMGPTWGPPGSCRPQMCPIWPHELCYQGSDTSMSQWTESSLAKIVSCCRFCSKPLSKQWPLVVKWTRLNKAKLYLYNKMQNVHTENAFENVAHKMLTLCVNTKTPGRKMRFSKLLFSKSCTWNIIFLFSLKFHTGFFLKVTVWDESALV